MKNDNRAWFYLTPALLMLGAVGLAPLMTMFNYSLQDSFSGDQFFWVGTRWYQDALRSGEFWGALGRTLLFTTISLAIQFSIGIFVARKLFHVQRNGASFIGFFALPLLAPWIVVGFLWRHAMQTDVGLVNVLVSYFGIIPDLNAVAWVWATIIVMDVWHWTSLTVILCFAGYVSIPQPYFHAAKIDGANHWATFRHIELPKLRQVIIIALLLRFADSLMIHIEPQMVSRGGPDVSTTFYSQELIRTAMQQFDLGQAGALAVCYLLLVVPVSWFLFRQMRRGNNV